MKLKQITLHDAIQCAGDGNVYIMIQPAGDFTHGDQWTEEDKPTQKKGKYDTGKICALRRASWSVAKIADEIGCSEQTVRNILKREGMV